MGIISSFVAKLFVSKVKNLITILASHVKQHDDVLL